MCGISVIVRKFPDANDCHAAIKRMATAQAHRGPDGSGFHYLRWETEEIWLGHNLLSLSAEKQESRQPMLSEDGECGIVFNGEIYNAGKLRRRLVLEGVSFQGNSDTEVLLKWLQKFGRTELMALEGMYAFVFWDNRQKRLIIHRDGTGIKPLLFAGNQNYLLFASEAAGLFAADLMPFEADLISLPYYLNYKFIPGWRTAWKEIQQVKPGECIEYQKSGISHFQVTRQSQIRYGGLETAINEAFSAVIPSHQEFGIALSGGIDSGLILSWCIAMGLKPQIFSLRFPENSPGFADTAAVMKMAEMLKLKINWVESREDDFLEITHCSSASDILVADSALVLTRRIARAASEKGIRILLSGAGADEWFGGYRRHSFFRKWQPWMELVPGSLMKWMLETIRPGKLAWMKWDAGSIEGLWQSAVSSCLNSSLTEFGSIPIPDEGDSMLEKMLRWDQQHYLVQDILCITDLAGMAEGVETRFPFLHPAMTDFAESTPLSQRMGIGRKDMLRDEFRKQFGSNLADRPKQGFGIPLPSFFEKAESRNQMEGWLKILQERLPEIWDKKNWNRFQQEALANPGKFQQEWISLGRLASWLQKN